LRRYSRYDKEGVVSFVPPDGKFKLLEYRSKGNIPLPINIVPTVMYQENGGTVKIQVSPRNIQDKNWKILQLPYSLPKILDQPH